MTFASGLPACWVTSTFERLEVAVNHAFLVSVLDGLADFLKQLESLAQAQCVLIAIRSDARAVDVLHDQVRTSRDGSAGIEHLRNARVLHQREHLTLGRRSASGSDACPCRASIVSKRRFVAVACVVRPPTLRPCRLRRGGEPGDRRRSADRARSTRREIRTFQHRKTMIAKPPDDRRSPGRFRRPRRATARAGRRPHPVLRMRRPRSRPPEGIGRRRRSLFLDPAAALRAL